MNFCGERFKPNLCRVQKKTNFSKKGCEIWVCQLKFFARKNSEFRPNECKCKIYIQEFCGKNRNFLRGSKSEFKQNQWMWRVFAIRNICAEGKANLCKTNECEGFLQSEIFARIDVHAFMQKKFYLHCVKYGSAFVILCVEVKANLGKTN